MIQVLNTMACNDSGLLHGFLIIKNVMNLIKVLIPVVLIILGMIDMLQAVIASDEKAMKSCQNKFVKRILASVIIFFVPVIVDFSFTSLAKLDLEYTDCWTIATKENIEKLKIEEEKAREIAKQKREEKRKQNENKENNQVVTDSTYALRKRVVTEALKYAGPPSHPYVWGGTKLCSNWRNESGCGVDCSAFVQTIYRKFNYNLPRTSREQAVYTGGTKITDFGTNFSNLKPGDLMFYKTDDRVTHVSMYTGEGTVVHAASSRTGVIISKADYTPAAWAVRIIK